MSEWPDGEREAYADVDDALRSYPLAPVPPGLSRDVLARVRAFGAPPRFGLRWSDYCLSAASAILAGFAWLACSALPAETWPDARATLLALLREALPLGVLLGLAGAGLLGGVLAGAAAAWLSRTRFPGRSG